MRDDLTIVYYTANVISDYFAENIRRNLVEVSRGLPIISVSKVPIDFGDNFLSATKRSYLSIYDDALQGANEAKTKYIVLCEDDVLYSPDHFKHVPRPGHFAYNLAVWMLFTWGTPMLSHKSGGRRTLCNLICERDLFIEAMEERFRKYPFSDRVDLSHWSEPGKYEQQLGVTVRETETFYSNIPNIVYSHEYALAFANLGMRKKLGEMRALEVPYWGTPEELMEKYRVEV